MNSPVHSQGQRFSGLSIAGFVCSWFVAPLGIILSALALSEVKRNPETLRGRGLAKWGIGLGILTMLIWVFAIFYFVGDARVRRANERSDRALEDYHRRNGR